MICINNFCVSSLQLFLIITITSIFVYFYYKLQDTISSGNKLLINKIKENEKKILSKEYSNTPNNTIPVNVKTRNITEVSQIGTLFKHSISDATLKSGDNDLSVVLPLFGRPLHTGSNKWIYYTNHNGLRLPIFSNSKQCDKEIGCNELYTDDTVQVPALNGDFKIHINEKEEFQYIPY
jgi:hypothetical protein